MYLFWFFYTMIFYLVFIAIFYVLIKRKSPGLCATKLLHWVVKSRVEQDAGTGEKGQFSAEEREGGNIIIISGEISEILTDNVKI